MAADRLLALGPPPVPQRALEPLALLDDARYPRPRQQRAAVAAGRRGEVAGAHEAPDLEEVGLDVGDEAIRMRDQRAAEQPPQPRHLGADRDGLHVRTVDLERELL